MICFPGFNIVLNIKKVAFTIFGISIYWYAVCIVLAMMVSIFLCCKSKIKYEISEDFILENLIYVIIFGILGARMYYVIFNLYYYLQNPIQILRIRDGGLAIYGGIIAGALVSFWRCKKSKKSYKNFLDRISPYVALGQAIGRWGNFFNQEAYGTETSNIFRMGINTEVGYQEVHPVFLYESMATFLIFIILRELQKNRHFKGEICYLYLFFYSAVRMFLEGVRIDSLMLQNFRISQILSLAIFVVFGIMLLKKYVKYRYSNT